MEVKNLSKAANRIMAILTIDTENLPSHFEEIIKEEQLVISKWKELEIIEHLFLRNSKNGAVLIFKGMDEVQVHELMVSLPLYPLKKNIEYFNLIKQF